MATYDVQALCLVENTKMLVDTSANNWQSSSKFLLITETLMLGNVLIEEYLEALADKYNIEPSRLIAIEDISFATSPLAVYLLPLGSELHTIDQKEDDA